jgi:predicted AAA+ superfamily ATPase
MDYINRLIQPNIAHAIERGKSILLLGSRQTGKSTLCEKFNPDLTLSFIQPHLRNQYQQNPSLLTGRIEALAEDLKSKPLIFLDEVQKVPDILDVVQDLIDRGVAQFILSGSSARKLRTGTALNLLPGRVVVFRLDPFLYSEIKASKPELEDLLLYGSLPNTILTKEKQDKELDLHSYVSTYLEEEIRSEALVRKVGLFARFLDLAASESGNVVNFRKLSQEIGVAHTTIATYYQILEDCLIAERIEPLSESKTRRKLTKTPKYIYFDLGVRRICAQEGTQLPQQYKGYLFEQWVGLELKRYCHLQLTWQLYFWRDPNGPEVDWVLKKEDLYIPIEVKWTDSPSKEDIKHLLLFKMEYPQTEKAYVICRVTEKIKLAPDVYALPWQALESIVASDSV